MTYDERRQAIKQTIDRSALSLAALVRETSYPYNYVADVLRGEPGKVSTPVLDAMEDELRRRGINIKKT